MTLQAAQITAVLAGVGRPRTGWPSMPRTGGDWQYHLWVLCPDGTWVLVVEGGVA